MTSKLRSWWQYIRKHWVVAIVLALAIVFVLIAYAGYWFNWEWTGLGPETSEPKQHAKTLWDWLGVFAIPIVVGLGAAWYTAQQGKVSNRENTDNQRETALQAYIDKMSELLLDKKLRESDRDSEVRDIARIQMLTALKKLDGERKGSIIQFLDEARLINEQEPIVVLRRADLSGADLRRAHLRRVNFGGADLSGADLSGAYLGGAYLSVTNFSSAYLSGANLGGADLRRADLSKADLSGADLSGADLSGADLSGADLSGATVA